MRHLLSLLAVFASTFQVGCASLSSCDYPPLSECQVERGEPNDVVDIAGNVLSIPSKILFWDKRVDNHCVSHETENMVKQYVVENGLESTKVRFNQYDPIGEWKRLATNTGIPPLLRYTAGTIRTLGYTILPGRLFGGDNYNPYTDTLSMYSDIPEFGMAEVAYAKDLRTREHRGWYAFGQEFPLIGMYHEGLATKDVLSYVASRDPRQEREAYEILMPRYGASWGSAIGGLIPDGNPVGTIAGGVIGHIAAWNRPLKPGQMGASETLVRGQHSGVERH